jgi:sugar lactone lactonase YvrE
MNAKMRSTATRRHLRHLRSRRLSAVLLGAALTGGPLIATSAWAVENDGAVQADAAQELVKCPSEDLETCTRLHNQEYAYAHAVAADSRGQVYFSQADYGSGGDLYRFSPGGEGKTKLADDLAPRSLAVDEQDGRQTLYWVDGEKLMKGDPDAEKFQPETVLDRLDGLGKVTLDGQGHAYINQGKTLRRIDLRAGQPKAKTVAVAAEEPRVLTVDRSGRYLYTADADGNVTRIDTSEEKPKPVSVATGLGTVSALTVDRGGTVFAADRKGEVHAVAPGNGTPAKVATGLNDVNGLALSPEGDLYSASTNVDYRNRPYAELWKVNALGSAGNDTPGPKPGKVSVAPKAGVWTTPGRPAQPTVKVTNTSPDYIGKEDIALALGPARVGWRDKTVRTGDGREFPCTVADDDGRKAVCGGVDLQLEPGETTELHTEVGTDQNGEVCEFPSVTWTIAGTTTKSDFVFKKPDGSPDRC